MPDTLPESELFGCKAGAFTDARKDKPGRFALAQGGTIFLDDIGDISPAMQIRLLRVLQEKQIEPLGAVQTVKVDVRVVAATNQDLEALVAENKCRKDLFYRIRVGELKLPELQQRRMERVMISEALYRHKGNRKRAAKDLGIDYSTLYRKIRSLKIETPSTDGRSRKE